MSINLTKGDSINLTKTTPQMRVAKFACGWDTKCDLDISAFILKMRDGTPKLIGDNFLCYFGNKNAGNGAVVSSGDNLTGEGSGDDETIVIDFSKLPEEAIEISMVCCIYDAKNRGQHFGMVKGAYCRVIDEKGVEVVKYNLTDDYTGQTGVQVASFYKNSNKEWEFKAIGAGYQKEIGDFVAVYK